SPIALVQNVAVRVCQSMGNRGMELRQLGFQLLIHQQECFQGAANIAVAPGDDLVDGGFMWCGTHRKASKYPRDNPQPAHGLLWIMWIARACKCFRTRTPESVQAPVEVIERQR